MTKQYGKRIASPASFHPGSIPSSEGKEEEVQARKSKHAKPEDSEEFEVRR
jgi:hypothetical protein